MEIPLDVPADEGQVPNYQPGVFYPANLGDILKGRFEILARIGWGTSSTVWLARETTWERLLGASE